VTERSVTHATYSCSLSLDQTLISISLATVELRPEPAGSR
jgi:hypothetical protein